MTTTLFVSGVVFYCLIFLLSVLGNVVVLCRCVWRVTTQASSIRWFIANLAVSDLTFMVLTLFDYVAYFWTWPGGSASCKLQGLLIEVCYTTSVMTLVVISSERRRAVVSPFSVRTRPSQDKKKKIICIWIASFVIGSPLLFAYNVSINESGLTRCTSISFGDLGKQIYYSIQGIGVFIIPVAYMLYAQIKIFRTLRSRAATTRCSFTTGPTNCHRKVAKTLAAFSIAFVVCWTPFIIFRTLVYFRIVEEETYSWVGCQLLILLNTVLDPILYGIYGENMKASLQRFFKCTCGRRFQESTLHP